MKQLYGLIGFPLGHSFSARFFADKFQKEKIEAEYQNFEIEHAEGLMEIVKSHPQLCGLNVTIPHKKNVIPLLDELSPAAREIGAVNVIKVERKNGEIRLVGHNADVIGFTRSLSPLLQPHHKKALVLGTGGASLAVLHGLKSLGIETLSVSRTPRAGQITYSDITPQLLADYPLIVNCTPVGMFPHVDECPPLPYEALSSANLLYDLVYNPEETLFLKSGREQGALTKNGLEMLHLQALASWEIWQGR